MNSNDLYTVSSNDMKENQEYFILLKDLYLEIDYFGFGILPVDNASFIREDSESFLSNGLPDVGATISLVNNVYFLKAGWVDEAFDLGEKYLADERKAVLNFEQKFRSEKSTLLRRLKDIVLEKENYEFAYLINCELEKSLKASQNLLLPQYTNIQ